MRKFTAWDWVMVAVIMGTGILANADPTYATTLSDVYAKAKGAITGIYGALFTIAAGIIGIIEYFMSGKNIGMLMTFIVVGVAPHLIIAFIGLLFPDVANIQAQSVGTTGTGQ